MEVGDVRAMAEQQAPVTELQLGCERVGELPDFLVKGYSEIVMRKTRGPLLSFKPRI